MMCTMMPVLGKREQLPAEVLGVFLTVFYTGQNIELT